jgi:3-hydroxyacyl-CoA dehydrogenase
MYKKGGGNWTKKLYEDEIANPYQGADQPEMLRKAAGKSFLGKYARVRNAEAAMDEVSGSDEKQVGKMVDATIEAAFANMEVKRDGRNAVRGRETASEPKIEL